MDIQKSYARDSFQSYALPVTEHFEYSSITSIFDSLLSIESLLKSLVASDTHTIKLNSKVKVIII